MHAVIANICLGLVGLGILASPGRAAEVTSCPASTTPPITAPLTRKALADHQELLIVALGSSSTQSWMSSDQAHSYPAILQAKLSELLPGAHVAVINRGIAGEDASEEIERIDRDVIAVRPAMVIWQVGANGVLRAVDPIVYKQLVTRGVERLMRAHIDVILMDNQRSPVIEGAPEHDVINQATADVAAATGAGLFSRSKLMQQWREGGMAYDRFISPDHMHHNDLGYRCLADAVASAIASGLGPDRVAAAKPGEGTPPGKATR